MMQRSRELFCVVAGHSPGYLSVLAGVAVLAAMVLVPAHLELERTKWRRDVMAAQASHLAELAERYRSLNRALAREDPVLLERLAYAQLRLRPVSKRAIPSASPPVGAIGAAAARLDDPTDIHAWLRRPLPEVGRELTPHRPVRTRLARLAEGRSRVGLVIAGGVLVFGGLLWSPTRSSNAAPGDG